MSQFYLLRHNSHGLTWNRVWASMLRCWRLT